MHGEGSDSLQPNIRRGRPPGRPSKRSSESTCGRELDADGAVHMDRLGPGEEDPYMDLESLDRMLASLAGNEDDLDEGESLEDDLLDDDATPAW